MRLVRCNIKYTYIYIYYVNVNPCQLFRQLIYGRPMASCLTFGVRGDGIFFFLCTVLNIQRLHAFIFRKFVIHSTSLVVSSATKRSALRKSDFDFHFKHRSVCFLPYTLTCDDPPSLRYTYGNTCSPPWVC